jgi:hypothetical protein
MNLRAQIELITVPQEFTRLCNAILIAEHGDDFLPIDDDRADRGNDGYLKSEKRMFAAHCFKRPQNQGIEKLIQSKMVGDLGKAIALKQAEIWPIDAWTFLSNYAVSDELGADLTAMGERERIDVAWRGPDYFAAALGRHPGVAAQFPGLQVHDLAARLEEIQDTLTERQDPESAPGTYAGAPGSATEQEELLRRRPWAWEYLLFAGVLKQRRAALEGKWRSQELRLPARTRRQVAEDDVVDYLRRSMQRLGALVEPMTRVFEDQQAAFGEPGEPGDPLRIEHFANWIMNAYEDMLDWGAELRATDAPSGFERAIALTAQIVDQPVGQTREFIDHTIREMGRIPEFLDLPEEEQVRNPLVIRAELVVSIDEKITEASLKELKRALKRR